MKRSNLGWIVAGLAVAYLLTRNKAAAAPATNAAGGAVSSSSANTAALVAAADVVWNGQGFGEVLAETLLE